MKFLYEYRTSDNVRHDGVVDAADREAAFTTLRLQGIRPGRLVEAPGFFNKLLGRGKRWIAICCLAATTIVLAVRYHIASSTLETSKAFETRASRRQIIGDATVIEKGIRTGWADFFEREGDRFLASFAVPGAMVAVRNTSEAEIAKVLKDRTVMTPARDTPEGRQIVAIVEGIKDELRRYLDDGGTIVGYGQRLVERQQSEQRFYESVKRELESVFRSHKSEAELLSCWESCNARLKKFGIRHISFQEISNEDF